MNLKELTVGMEFKNYNTLCEYFDEKAKGGKSKQCQINNWERYFRWEKRGQKFIITEIFETPIEKDKTRRIGVNRKIENRFINCNKELYSLIINADENMTIYSIEPIKHLCIKCGQEVESTCLSMYRAKGKCDRCCLSKNAIIIYDYLKDNNLEFKTEYTFSDLKSDNNFPLRFDFALFEDDDLKILIEYDGEYHDERFNKSGTYDIQIKHDSMKDEYCLNNKIPLLRINFDENVILKLHNNLLDFFPNLTLSKKFEAISELNSLYHQKYLYKIAIKELDEKINKLKRGVSFND